MRRYGLIGYPLGHSFSKSYFTDFFAHEKITDSAYENFAIENIGLIERVISDKELCGFNVTIPYKQQIIPYLDHLSPEAESIGAVNCVKIEGGKLYGFNTDCYGFRMSLLSLIGPKRPAALVLGSGGAAKAVCHVLGKLGIEYSTVSRTPQKGSLGYGQLSQSVISSHRLIVNTTPVGMYPKTDDTPALPFEYIGKEHFLYDLIYNPAKTRFLQLGEQNGARTMNGERMLVLQAEKSWEIWNSDSAVSSL